MAFLEIRGLTKNFGGLTAVSQVDFDLNQGEILGMIGPNGAGKSTVFNMISGAFLPTSGAIIFRNENITRLPPYVRANRGITRVFQGNILFRNFTVLTNVLIGRHLHTKIGWFGFLFGTPAAEHCEKVCHNEALEILEMVGLSGDINELAGSLPHGKQRLLCLAIALAGNPSLLLLDEPVTGMNAEEVSAMVNLIKELRDKRGITSIVVEHNMKAVMGLCDRIVTLSYGKKIAEGTPKEISENKAVIEAYLGAEQDVA